MGASGGGSALTVVAWFEPAVAYPSWTYLYHSNLYGIRALSTVLLNPNILGTSAPHLRNGRASVSAA